MINNTEVYGIYDDEFNLLFPDAISISASITESADVMSHAVEDGSMISDHRVLKPVEITLSLFLPAEKYNDTFKLIRQAFHGNDIYHVNTRVGIYRNMAISSMPHEESPEQFDTVSVSLQLNEVKIVETQYQELSAKKVADDIDSSTVNRCEQTGK